ncbi:MAG: amidohydrolase family protein [Caldilineaceae bacterium]|nr:amidohydrolase family protein [Caldilineaceae bacterium]
MPTALADFIQTTPLCDSHEHLRSEKDYVEDGPDLLKHLFGNYVAADLVVAGAGQAAVDRLLNPSDPDIRARFTGVERAWQSVRYTGYGEAVRIIARELYGLDEITADGLEAALPLHAALRQPGQRLHILRERANLDHIQTDDFVRACAVDPSGPDFFFYDISWVSCANGEPDIAAITAETGVAIRDLATLRQAMEAVFAQNAAAAIAVKSQHAYNRTLRWQERSDAETAPVLAAYLRDPQSLSQEERLCLGDWSLARGVELAIEYDLPFKIHTGYYAGHSRMPVDFIKPGNLCPLLAKYPEARFVLMHIGYPYNDEMVALAKHYPNVYVDFCWAWSIDPFSTGNFLRQCIHAVPSNKIFLFGGDTSWAGAALAYASQARAWFTRTLQAEIDGRLLTEAEAIALAGRYMRDNQYDCFRVADKKRLATSNQKTK